MDWSHFVPVNLVNHLDHFNYGDASLRAQERILRSPYNCSDATAHWNRGINKRHENMIVDYALGDRTWGSLTPGAQRRYFEQQGAWRDIRTDFRREAPGLARELSKFYSRQYYLQSRCIPCLSLSLCVCVCVCVCACVRARVPVSVSVPTRDISIGRSRYR